VRNNQQYVNPGANFMLLNGMLVEVKNFEIYSEWGYSTAQYSITQHACYSVAQHSSVTQVDCSARLPAQACL
jgi:hypothetical protein